MGRTFASILGGGSEGAVPVGCSVPVGYYAHVLSLTIKIGRRRIGLVGMGDAIDDARQIAEIQTQ
jgi:hypothetical protein